MSDDKLSALCAAALEYERFLDGDYTQAETDDDDLREDNQEEALRQWEAALAAALPDAAEGWSWDREDEVVHLVAIFAERIAEYEKAINQPHHALLVDDDGWCLEHVMACRVSGLSNCPLNRLAGDFADELRADSGPGKYVVRLARDTRTSQDTLVLLLRV
jgi:hypothetical protein